MFTGGPKMRHKQVCRGITHYLRSSETRRFKENSKLRGLHKRLRLQVQRPILKLVQNSKQFSYKMYKLDKNYIFLR